MIRLEDTGGDLLEGMLGRPIELPRFLQIAIALAVALREIHRRGLVHKDIRPANISVDAAARVRLTGFGIASRLPRQRQPAPPPETIEGTFPYMAPEQTGRMSRSIDGRSDLYSLGVTLYEMITGKLPFSASDPMEWIHFHIARQPTPPSGQTSGIPEPIDAIILRLLAKSADDRYQTAAGLEADLRRCQAQREAHGRIDTFPLGLQDVSDRLLIPERLYLGDRVQLQQVLLNLIMNGVEAMSGVAERTRELIVTSTLAEPGSVLVSVEDTGVGLDPAVAKRIFEPFFTTKSDGLGIGLSICRSIIEGHRGRLWVSPPVPHGAAIRFTVPIELSQ